MEQRGKKRGTTCVTEFPYPDPYPYPGAEEGSGSLVNMGYVWYVYGMYGICGVCK